VEWWMMTLLLIGQKIKMFLLGDVTNSFFFKKIKREKLRLQNLILDQIFCVFFGFIHLDASGF